MPDRPLIPDNLDPRLDPELDRSARQSDPASDEGDPLGALTAKQRQVLDLLIEHKTSKEISRLLGISPHTVDQRILLARTKLGVGTRSEVAQAYRRLLASQPTETVDESALYGQSVYGLSHVATAPSVGQVRPQEDEEAGRLPSLPAQPALLMGNAGGEALAEPYHHVLPEMFDGPNGTLLRLGAMTLITVFLILIVMGGLAMFAQLSQLVDP